MRYWTISRFIVAPVTSLRRLFWVRIMLYRAISVSGMMLLSNGVWESRPWISTLSCRVRCKAKLPKGCSIWKDLMDMSSIIGSLLSSKHCFIKSTMRGECASSKSGKNKAVNITTCWKFMPKKPNPKCIMPWLGWKKGSNSVRLKVYNNRLSKINLFKRNDCFLNSILSIKFFII